MANMPSRSLRTYRDKRLADATPEPFGHILTPATGKLFVVQQHRASHMHWDLRLEIDGVLRSWAVPKGPSANIQDKRFAALVEDHPLDYGSFEGLIPPGNYGAGEVIIWDRGTWKPLQDVREGFKKGKLLFELNGFKLHGRWTLVRMKSRREVRASANEWLLIKERDQWADENLVYSEQSVLSGLTVAELKDPSPKVRQITSAARRLDGAVKTSDPIPSDPMLATAGQAFDGKDWLFELKYDGYRLIIDKGTHGVTLRSRNGHDLTRSFPEIALTASRMQPGSFVMDGELVVLSDRGIPDFSLLQSRARLSRELEVARMAIELPCTYFAFDLLRAGTFDIRQVPLEKRKRLLAKMVPSHGAIRYSDHVAGNGRATFDAAARLGLEGVVGKRRNSRYQAGRSPDWVKVRHQKTGDFVILGWSSDRNDRGDIGAVALGEYRRGDLVFVGKAGSGLNSPIRIELATQFDELKPGSPFSGITASQAKRIHWIEPVLACEVSYKEYTRDGHLRHPVFLRLRLDKSISTCTGGFDDPGAVVLVPAEEPTVTVTHPEKEFFPERQLTKSDLIRYYEKISRWMLPYLENRPIVLTRFPDGIHGKSFYQRDAPDFVPDWIRREVLWSEGAKREIHYFIVESTAALKYLANLGTIPIHTAHSRVTDLEHPDWCVLDLDPKSAPFEHVILLAKAIGELADELELPAYLKTSGKSGLHVIVPLARQLTHEHARTLAQLMAREVINRYPDQATVARSLAARQGKVYVDTLQNGQGQLLVAPFSARAEPAASVSMPLRWSELNGRLSNENYHITNAVRRLARLGEDPMKPLLADEPDLHRSLTRLAAISA